MLVSGPCSHLKANIESKKVDRGLVLYSSKLTKLLHITALYLVDFHTNLSHLNYVNINIK